jgi:hypothetical protein
MDPCAADAYIADGAIFANRIMMNEMDPAVRKAHHTSLSHSGNFIYTTLSQEARVCFAVIRHI